MSDLVGFQFNSPSLEVNINLKNCSNSRLHTDRRIGPTGPPLPFPPHCKTFTNVHSTHKSRQSVFCKLFHKTEKGRLLTHFYEASFALIPNPDKHITRKLQNDLFPKIQMQKSLRKH